MQQRANRKTTEAKQKRDRQSNVQIQRQTEGSSNAQTHDSDLLGNITCRIGDNACAAKHISAIHGAELFHRMNESRKVRSILRLQQQYGNRFVQRVIAQSVVQAKLRIGQPGDRYEQEADRVAAQVMRMPDPQVQRQPETEEEEKLVETKSLVEQITPLVQRQVEEEEVQVRGFSDQASEVAPDLEARVNSIRGNGQPLPASTRAFFEPRFGCDFSQVRMHTGAAADALSRSLNARAFTTGQDVLFRQQVNSPSDRELLAHELTHVIQQRGIGTGIVKSSLEPRIQRQSDGSASGKGKAGCKYPTFTGQGGLDIGGGRIWYPHDFVGPIRPENVRAEPSSTGYNVPRSATPNYNCMGWALCHSQPTSGAWLQGVSRSEDHPWPEEEFLASKGCKTIAAGTSANHRVKLYEYRKEDQFHIVRQEGDGLWSSKTGDSYLWRGIQNPNAHTTSHYSQKMSDLRATYWSCP